MSETGGFNMSEYLPEDVREGLRAAAKQKRRKMRHRLTIHVGHDAYPILRVFDRGFEVDAEDTPNLRGLVDIFDGPRHLTQALIVATSKGDGVMRYEFKRNTQASDKAPLDFERESGQPHALLPNDA